MKVFFERQLASSRIENAIGKIHSMRWERWMPSSPMAGMVFLFFLLLCLQSLGLMGCAHPVKLDSTPPGATIFVDGEDKGTAPVVIMEQPGCFASRDLRIELPGHTPVETKLAQTEPVWFIVIPSVCLVCPTFGLSCLGLQYGTQYGQEYEYRLSPMTEDRLGGGEEPADDAESPFDSQQTIPY
jgi:hypothetical protein